MIRLANGKEIALAVAKSPKAIGTGWLQRYKVHNLTDQELSAMATEEVDKILADMTYTGAQVFLERIGHLRAWLVYADVTDA